MIEITIAPPEQNLTINTQGAVEVQASDYNLLANKPTLNGRVLENNFTLEALDVGAVPIVDKMTNTEIEQMFGGI